MATKKKAAKKAAPAKKTAAVTKKAAPAKKKAAVTKKAAPAKKKAAVTKKAAPAKKKAAVTKKAAPAKKRKAVAPAAMKAAPVKKKAAPARKKPLARRDGGGHLNPRYAADLRKRSQASDSAVKSDDRAFLRGKRTDALADEMGREFVETVTSGEDEGNEVRDGFQSEEIGGPFVGSTAGREFAYEPDASNPKDATREPFPRA